MSRSSSHVNAFDIDSKFDILKIGLIFTQKKNHNKENNNKTILSKKTVSNEIVHE